jgi:hypothetical protein
MAVVVQWFWCEHYIDEDSGMAHHLSEDYVCRKEQPTVAGLETDSGACGFVVVVVVVVVDVWQSSATAWLQCVATCRCTNRSHGQ